MADSLRNVYSLALSSLRLTAYDFAVRNTLMYPGIVHTPFWPLHPILIPLSKWNIQDLFWLSAGPVISHSVALLNQFIRSSGLPGSYYWYSDGMTWAFSSVAFAVIWNLPKLGPFQGGGLHSTSASLAVSSWTCCCKELPAAVTQLGTFTGKNQNSCSLSVVIAVSALSTLLYCMTYASMLLIFFSNKHTFFCMTVWTFGSDNIWMTTV